MIFEPRYAEKVKMSDKINEQQLAEFQKHSSYPSLLDASFNVKGHSIVCTPQDAVTTYLSTQLDLLFIGNFMVVKKDGKL